MLTIPEPSRVGRTQIQSFNFTEEESLGGFLDTDHRYKNPILQFPYFTSQNIIIPQSTQFYSVVPYSTLYYSILVYSILFCSILFYSILFYSILFYSILFYSISQRDQNIVILLSEKQLIYSCEEEYYLKPRYYCVPYKQC